MHVTETIALLDVIAIAEKRGVGESDVEFWDEALEDLTYADCREAVRLWFREPQRWPVKPGDVRNIVRSLRTERHMRPVVAPNGCTLAGCCTGELIAKPKWFDEVAVDARLAARETWFGADGRHRAYVNAKEAK
jgi:hypothetical protein